MNDQQFDSKIQYHNIAVMHGQYIELDQEFVDGDRFRLSGTLPADKIQDEFIAKKHEANGSQVDTWARIIGNVSKSDTVINVQLDSLDNQSVKLKLTRGELTALATQGEKLLREKEMLAKHLAEKCKEDKLIPVWSSNLLKDMRANQQIVLGEPLLLDGVSYGIVTDYINADGQVVVTTDSHMLATLSLENAMKYLEFGVYEYMKPIEGVDPISKDILASFIYLHHDALPLRYKDQGQEMAFPGYTQTQEMLNNRRFVQTVGQILANYMHMNQIDDILRTSNNKVINDVANIISSQMVSHGFTPPTKPVPTQEEIQYLQSLGYSQEGMAQKAEILARWLKEKELTASQMVVAQSIADGKILHSITDIDKDSMKACRDIPFLYRSVDNLGSVFLFGGKINCDHTNLALAQSARESIKIEPEIYDSKKYGEGQSVYANQNDMWVTWDVSKEYHELGGFDYQLALEMSQNGGKSQKEESHTFDKNEQNQEEAPSINHFDLIERS